MQIVLVIVGLVLLVWAGLTFNRLVRLRNRVAAAWADIDVQLTRRHDLVPSLVSAVEGYATHERETLARVTRLRAEATALDSPALLADTEASLERGISRLLALREAYPELRADEGFERLQRDLVDVEDHLQFARRFYNGSVRDYNTALERIPDLAIARGFGFRQREYFQAEENARTAPGVGLP